MENNELNKRVIESVRNRVTISNLESEATMKRGKTKKSLSLAVVMIVMLTGAFATVNAATNGELVEQVKKTIQVIFTDKDGNQKEIEGTSYTDSDNHTIEKYQMENDGTEYTLEADKNNLDDESLTIEGNINDEGVNITIKDKE